MSSAALSKVCPTARTSSSSPSATNIRNLSPTRLSSADSSHSPGNADEPLAVLLMVKDAYGSRRLMLENASIDVSGSVTADSVNGMPNYDLEKLTVTGSPLSARYDSLMSVHQSMDSLYQANARNYKDVPREVRKKWMPPSSTLSTRSTTQPSCVRKTPSGDRCCWFH